MEEGILMGRFEELWRSGKLAIQNQEKFSKNLEQEIGQHISAMAPEYAAMKNSLQTNSQFLSQRGPQTGRWLMELAGQKLSAPAEAQAAPPAHQEAGTEQRCPKDQELALWVDKLFKELSTLVYEFNKRCADNQQRVSCEMPRVVETRDLEIWYKPLKRVWHGRLTSRSWAMLITGNKAKIEARLVPSSLLLAIDAGSISDQDFPPLVELRHIQENSHDCWKINDQDITIGIIRPLAKELFADLIRVTNGTFSEIDLNKLQLALANLQSETPTPNRPPSQVPKQTSVVDPNRNYENKFDYVENSESSAESASATTNPRPLTITTLIDPSELTLIDACDLVDLAVDKLRNNLYQEASQTLPAQSADLRLQISALETFHNEMLRAFENYSKTIHKNQSKH
jgi:hypothetical protein